ncbi:oxidoreductase [Bacillus timonensis]|uniref:Oxidoreductase n=1 Tax=Bacillus timonensis TaxID=1033734 RepID=A0A4S3PR49_9BACI|nr:oxidoreductase [Bacillus timonensis]THE11735.1 oxidoreductase [Bacillus timonensis]
MKNLLIVVSSLVILLLIISIFQYEKSFDGTPPVQEDMSSPSENRERPESLQPTIVADSIGYTLQNNELKITYDNGDDWVTVPVKVEQLFSGEYNGNQTELINDSFILTDKRATFLYIEGAIKLITSLDKGVTWQESLIYQHDPGIRFRKVDFLNEKFGYVIVSGDRTMSQEWSATFMTNDGGKTWRETAYPGTTRLIYNGTFVDENTGFLSYGIINPEEPDFYVTTDSGFSWKKATFSIPEKYHQIFVTAELPFKEDDHFAVLLNQGPNGDYMGGKVKGKFVSFDQGLSWEFASEVAPNE